MGLEERFDLEEELLVFVELWAGGGFGVGFEGGVRQGAVVLLVCVLLC